MLCHRSNSLGKSWSICFTTILCIVLLFACGMIQAVHSHPDGDAYHSACPLCVVAHATVEQVTPPALLSVVSVVALVESPVQWLCSKKSSTFALFTRPPPADPVFN
jgi:hypothetical protein